MDILGKLGVFELMDNDKNFSYGDIGASDEGGDHYSLSQVRHLQSFFDSF
jgi:hypothetical protein